MTFCFWSRGSQALPLPWLCFCFWFFWCQAVWMSQLLLGFRFFVCRTQLVSLPFLGFSILFLQRCANVSATYFGFWLSHTMCWSHESLRKGTGFQFQAVWSTCVVPGGGKGIGRTNIGHALRQQRISTPRFAGAMQWDLEKGFGTCLPLPKHVSQEQCTISGYRL